MNKWFDEQFAKKKTQQEVAKTPAMAIITTKGTMDWSYPLFILAATGAAQGWDVSIFFTFHGLGLLKKDLKGLEAGALDNPDVPMRMPYGPKWSKETEWEIPALKMASVQGFEKTAIGLLMRATDNIGVASIVEMRTQALKAGVKMVACRMSANLFGIKREDFIPEVKDYVRAVNFVPMAQRADISLFI